MALFENKENYLEWLSTDEGKTIALPVMDSKITAALKTYSEKHPTKENLSPRLEAIETKIAEKEKLLKENDLKFFAFKKCTENGIDFELLNGFPFDTEESISDKIEQLSTLAQSTKNREIVEKSYRPSFSGLPNSKGKNFNDFLLEAEERDRQ